MATGAQITDDSAHIVMLSEFEPLAQLVARQLVINDLPLGVEKRRKLEQANSQQLATASISLREKFEAWKHWYETQDIIELVEVRET